MFSTLGKIPAVGETLQAGGVELHVLDADDRQIQRLRVTVLEPQHTEH